MWNKIHVHLVRLQLSLLNNLCDSVLLAWMARYLHESWLRRGKSLTRISSTSATVACHLYRWSEIEISGHLQYLPSRSHGDWWWWWLSLLHTSEGHTYLFNRGWWCFLFGIVNTCNCKIEYIESILQYDQILNSIVFIKASQTRRVEYFSILNENTFIQNTKILLQWPEKFPNFLGSIYPQAFVCR